MDDRFYKHALKSERATMDHALLAYRFVELVAREKRQVLGYAKMLKLVTYIVQNFCVGSPYWGISLGIDTTFKPRHDSVVRLREAT